jgi:hypothetical protein
MLSSKQWFLNATTQSFSQIDDHGVCRGNTGQILAQWQLPVASSVAMDLLHRTMRTSLHRCITMTVKMASKGGALFYHRQFVVVHNRS